MREGVILSGANFVPQGNNLSTRIREKDKGKRSWQTTNFRGDSQNPSNHVLSKNVCCVRSFSSRSLCQSSRLSQSPLGHSTSSLKKTTWGKSARVPKYCVGLCRFSLSLPAEFQSVVWKDLRSRSVISQSCKVLCRMVSLVVL